MATKRAYGESEIRSLESRDHIRLRPGMYIGKLGDGTSDDDGIYVLFKEVLDNTLDEFTMGHGSRIEIEVTEKSVLIRDYGRGIPHGKLVDCVSKINTGAKYGSDAFEKSIGMNGVGVKAVNALSSDFVVRSYRDGKCRHAKFKKGKLKEEGSVKWDDEFSLNGLSPVASSANGKNRTGTEVLFTPDEEIFGVYNYETDKVKEKLRLISFLNKGLSFVLNGEEISAPEGFKSILSHYASADDLVIEPIYIRGTDVELNVSYMRGSREKEFSFVNGHHTKDGGTHINYFKDCFVKAVNDILGKSYDPQDIKNGLSFAIAIRIHDPVFESQTKMRLGSTKTKIEKSHPLYLVLGGTKGGPDFIEVSLKSVIEADVVRFLSPLLMANKETLALIEERIKSSEHERKEIQGLKKIAKTKEKEASFYNKKLRDSKMHWNSGSKKKESTMLFITEGDSAAGSINQVRDIDTQAVFCLRGKPMNTLGVSRKVIYGNEELNLLQQAIGLDDDPENARYRKIVIATDSDVDGMHIRLLLMTFFLQFYPRLIEHGFIQFLITPLFRARKKGVIGGYFYSDQEIKAYLDKMETKERNATEVTRFKGLGEISPSEMKDFIAAGKIKLIPMVIDIKLNHDSVPKVAPAKKESKSGKKSKNDNGLNGNSIEELLRFYMGSNSPERQEYVLKYLRETI